MLLSGIHVSFCLSLKSNEKLSSGKDLKKGQKKPRSSYSFCFAHPGTRSVPLVWATHPGKTRPWGKRSFLFLCISSKSAEVFPRRPLQTCSLVSTKPMSKSITGERNDDTVIGLDKSGLTEGLRMGSATSLSTLSWGSFGGFILLPCFVLNKSFLRKRHSVMVGMFGCWTADTNLGAECFCTKQINFYRPCFLNEN